MANSAEPDQLASPTDLDLHCLQRQGISGFRRTRVKGEHKSVVSNNLWLFFCIIYTFLLVV